MNHKLGDLFTTVVVCLVLVTVWMAQLGCLSSHHMSAVFLAQLRFVLGQLNCLFKLKSLANITGEDDWGVWNTAIIVRVLIALTS